jgi:uncharacterized circularly permuted ATP-grasp superfamily protein
MTRLSSKQRTPSVSTSGSSTPPSSATTPSTPPSPASLAGPNVLNQLRAQDKLALTTTGTPATHALRLGQKNGKVTEIPSPNYYFDDTGAVRPGLDKLVETVMLRAPEKQLQLDAQMKKMHADYGMSFARYLPDHTKEFFEVPVHGAVVPVTAGYAEALAKSSEPVMRALRGLLQKTFSVPREQWSAETLGLGSLPKADADQVIDTLKATIYFEPKLIAPQMKDYPFLTVVGFDFAVSDPTNATDPRCFEFNSGTPSGFANIALEKEWLRRVDPDQYAAIKDRLTDDRSFQVLRSAIDSNAQKWTGRADGISVTVGPGPGNGAHPDVAAIATYSGMPLVGASDLYMGDDGWVRLRSSGTPEQDPVVTGIYGRAEDTFFMQSNEAGIPARTPDLEESNVALSKKLGVHLEPGVMYSFVKNKNGEVVNVNVDKHGKPKLLPLFDAIGPNPNHPEPEVPFAHQLRQRMPVLEPSRGAFVDAIVGKKLYFSGLMGRVVDDKRIFENLAEHLAPQHLREGETSIARPPKTLKSDAEYQAFYDCDVAELGNYVVKEPNKSGGDGIYLMVNLDAARRQEIVAAVKARPGDFIVQEFAKMAVMTTPEADANGEVKWGSAMNDWRYFSVMDGEGNVDPTASAFLGRAAQPFSASTNTSQGASYFVGVVLEDEKNAVARPAEASILPARQSFTAVPESKAKLARELMNQVNLLTEWTAPSGIGLDPKAKLGSFVADTYLRPIMDVLGVEYSPLMAALRGHDEGKVTREELHQELFSFRLGLYDDADYPGAAKLKLEIDRNLSAWAPPLAELQPLDHAEELARRAEARTHFDIKRFDKPELTRASLDGSEQIQKYETGVYTRVDDPIAQAFKTELESMGGELRLTQNLKSPDSSVDRDELKNWDDLPASAYFRVSGEGQPIIAIDLAQPRALAGLAHEMEHFRMWRDELQIALASPGAITPLEAALEANEATLTPDNRYEGERRAVQAELRIENRSGNLNSGVLRPTQEHQPGFVARFNYPHVESVRDALHREKWSKEPINPSQVSDQLQRAIINALRSRRVAHAHYAQVASPTNETKALKGYFKNVDLFDMIFDRGATFRFNSDGTSKRLQELFWNAFDEIVASGAQRGLLLDSSDLERFAMQKRAQAQAQQQQ